MTKKELAVIVAHRNKLPAKQVEAIINDAIHVIKTALIDGEKVQLTGFGTLQIRERVAHKGHNPRTGEEVFYPALKVPGFTSSKSFKAIINEN